MFVKIIVDRAWSTVIDFRAKLPVNLVALVGSPMAALPSGRQPTESPTFCHLHVWV